MTQNASVERSQFLFHASNRNRKKCKDQSFQLHEFTLVVVQTLSLVYQFNFPFVLKSRGQTCSLVAVYKSGSRAVYLSEHLISTRIVRTIKSIEHRILSHHQARSSHGNCICKLNYIDNVFDASKFKSSSEVLERVVIIPLKLVQTNKGVALAEQTIYSNITYQLHKPPSQHSLLWRKCCCFRRTFGYYKQSY